MLPVNQDPPHANRLKKKTIMMLIFSAFFISVCALGFNLNNTEVKSKENRETSVSDNMKISVLQGVPEGYGDLQQKLEKEIKTISKETPKIPDTTSFEEKKTPPQEDKLLKGALVSSIFFDPKQSDIKKTDNNWKPNSSKTRTSQEGKLDNYLTSIKSSLDGGSIGQSTMITDQQNKKAFSKQKDDDTVYLQSHIQKPISKYQIMAGAIIPCALITGINSDLPGQIIAQVRENVFDTVSGNYLLVPQGTRVIGNYDNMVSWAQERVLLAWNRLIMPNGNSITLLGMPGTDSEGYSGVKDRVNNHYLRITSAILLSSFLAVGTRRSQGSISGTPTLGQEIGDSVAGDMNEAGQKIIGRHLNVPPTLTVRPGVKLNIMVNKDMVLVPYEEG